MSIMDGWGPGAPSPTSRKFSAAAGKAVSQLLVEGACVSSESTPEAEAMPSPSDMLVVPSSRDPGASHDREALEAHKNLINADGT